MDLAKVSSKGQITVPIDVRKKLNIKQGDKLLFSEVNGIVTIRNAGKGALPEVQTAFAGEARRVGWNDEQDVIDYISELRNDKHQ